MGAVQENQNMKLYRNFSSQEEIDREYNLALSVPDIDNWLKWYSQQSKLVRNKIDCVLSVKYGPTVDETVDIFPAKDKGAPLLLFIHGGYWVRCSSKDFSFVAAGLVKQGISVAVSNYSLCPEVSITEITRQSRALVAWLYRESHNVGIDPSNIFVAGHSAGGQQVGMLLATNWKNTYGLPNEVIKGGIPISGIFDLSPLLYSYLQPKLQLNHQSIIHQSPHLCIPESDTPLLISVGEKETSEFRRQSAEYFQAWSDRGNACEQWIEKGKNHFSVIESLNDSDSSFCRGVVDFINRTKE